MTFEIAIQYGLLISSRYKAIRQIPHAANEQIKQINEAMRQA